MQCWQCGGTLHEEKTTLDFLTGGQLVVVADVPALVCQQCGETEYTLDTYDRLYEIRNDVLYRYGHFTCSDAKKWCQ